MHDSQVLCTLEKNSVVKESPSLENGVLLFSVLDIYHYYHLDHCKSIFVHFFCSQVIKRTREELCKTSWVIRKTNENPVFLIQISLIKMPQK